VLLRGYPPPTVATPLFKFYPRFEATIPLCSSPHVVFSLPSLAVENDAFLPFLSWDCFSPRFCRSFLWRESDFRDGRSSISDWGGGVGFFRCVIFFFGFSFLFHLFWGGVCSPLRVGVGGLVVLNRPPVISFFFFPSRVSLRIGGC